MKHPLTPAVQSFNVRKYPPLLYPKIASIFCGLAAEIPSSDRPSRKNTSRTRGIATYQLLTSPRFGSAMAIPNIGILLQQLLTPFFLPLGITTSADLMATWLSEVVQSELGQRL